ncbi:hypothetical protein GS399_19570 [Pedobacter sp. HMF7647]|uniref:Uncharacterized protein n=1 Tax=Hufsiella arboris TaxID=2695275 RepID=A0A7K1YFJ8_9SPHI|nr:hypothetical protein [Hufsiella arboris]MXV53171.1 hypothetical protein [Hufsiella arboris]
MKRFKTQFSVNGENSDLIVEAMDNNKHQFSVEREINDPQPLLIENTEDGWKASSSSWLAEAEIRELGNKILSEMDGAEPFDTGVNAR